MNASKSSAAPRYVILAAIDMSPHADGVIAAASRLARATPGAEIHVVHALDPRDLQGFPIADVYATAMTEHRAFIDKCAKDVNRAAAADVVAHLSEGDPWRAIVQTAASIDADLVIVGTHGRRGVARWVMGSIAEQVVRHAACPVYVVRPKDHVGVRAPEIEPPCPDCLRVQRESHGRQLWCARHSEHHPRAHLHYEAPQGFGAGSSLIQPES